MKLMLLVVPFTGGGFLAKLTNFIVNPLPNFLLCVLLVTDDFIAARGRVGWASTLGQGDLNISKRIFLAIPTYSSALLGWNDGFSPWK